LLLLLVLFELLLVLLIDYLRVIMKKSIDRVLLAFSHWLFSKIVFRVITTSKQQQVVSHVLKK